MAAIGKGKRLAVGSKIAGLIIALLLPLVFRNNSYIVLLLCTSAISIITVAGLDILFGYSGQISLGHAGFYAIGAYTSAILSTKLGIPVWLTILAGGALAAVAAVIIAIPSIKLVHHFLALMTIAFGQLVALFVSNAERLTGGFSGFNFIPRLRIGALEFNTNFKMYYVILLFMLVLLVVKQRIIHSRTGRAFIAIRENTPSADGMGVNIRRYKVMAFGVSALYAGLSGALYAHLIGFISPENFHLNQSIIFLTMLLLGGMANFWGPVVGALVLTIISEYLQALGSYQMLVYGCVLLLVVVFVPGGLTGGLNPLQYFKNIRMKRS